GHVGNLGKFPTQTTAAAPNAYDGHVDAFVGTLNTARWGVGDLRPGAGSQSRGGDYASGGTGTVV
ncbi:MAG: hypothetical protein ACYS8I_16065, partial [Planctomycetota bacterium]